VTIAPGNFNAPDADCQGIVTDAIAYLKLAALLDSQAVNINCGLPLDGNRSAFPGHALRQAAGLKRVAQEAARFGLQLNIEAPHRNGLCRTLDDAEFLLDAIDEPNVKFLLDVTHVQAGASRPDAAVARFGSRIGHVHLRDGIEEDIFHLPGTGTVDFRSFFAALLDQGYDGFCALELEGVGETLQELRGSLRRATDFLLSQTVADFGLSRAVPPALILDPGGVAPAAVIPCPPA
jgi:sugar phosphate isomerase/epimerase